MNKIKRAEELLKTYFLLKDSKIFLPIVRITLEAMDDVLSKFSNGSFEEKLLFYKMNIEPKYNLDSSFGKIMQQAHKILHEHVKSPVEIAFKDKIFIYSEDYNLTELNEEFVTVLIKKAKLFIEAFLSYFLHE